MEKAKNAIATHIEIVPKPPHERRFTEKNPRRARIPKAQKTIPKNKLAAESSPPRVLRKKTPTTFRTANIYR